MRPVRVWLGAVFLRMVFPFWLLPVFREVSRFSSCLPGMVADRTRGTATLN
jgi:hypothetical protein